MDPVIVLMAEFWQVFSYLQWVSLILGDHTKLPSRTQLCQTSSCTNGRLFSFSSAIVGDEIQELKKLYLPFTNLNRCCPYGMYSLRYDVLSDIPLNKF